MNDDVPFELTPSPPVVLKNKKGRVKSTYYAYDLVEVRWDDAFSNASWQDAPKHPLTHNVAIAIGFLIREEEGYLLIANGYFEEDAETIGGTTQIPRGMVKSARVLRRKSK